MYKSICISIYSCIMYLSIDLSIYLSSCLAIYLSTYLSTYLSIHPSIHLSNQSVCRLIDLSLVYLSIFPYFLSIYHIKAIPIYLNIYLWNIYLSICLSFYLFIYLPTYLSIYLQSSTEFWKWKMVRAPQLAEKVGDRNQDKRLATVRTFKQKNFGNSNFQILIL